MYPQKKKMVSQNDGFSAITVYLTLLNGCIFSAMKDKKKNKIKPSVLKIFNKI